MRTLHKNSKWPCQDVMRRFSVNPFRPHWQSAIRIVLLLVSAALVCKPVRAQQYTLQDEFNGTFNSSLWSVHNSTWNLQRTRFGNTPQIMTEGSTSFARFTLDTFNLAYPGTATKGTEVWSNGAIALGSGMQFETRMRATNLPRGAVMAFYTYRDRPAGDLGQQEIDFEFLGNQPTNQLWLNVWTSTTRNAQTSPVVSGLNRANWVTYKVRWLSNRVEWSVDDVLVRSETSVVPTDAMKLGYNIWAANSSWSNAYDGSLATAATAAANKSAYFDVDYVRVGPIPGSSPYGTAAAAIPGTIQAENYDKGGEGIAYHDATSANEGKAYRTTEAVDIEPSTDTGAGYNLGWTAAGEWLQYSVNVSQAGTYDVLARVACNSGGGKFHIEFNGVDKTGPLTIPNTGNWQAYQSLVKTNVQLSAGVQMMRLVFDGIGTSGAVGNINYLTFTRNTGTDTTKPVVTITLPPTNGYSYKSLSQIVGTASDTGGSNLASTRVLLQRDSDKLFWTGSAWGAATELAATGTANWTFKLPALTDDKYSVSAIARDGAGNATTSAPVNFFIDNLAPVITIVAPKSTTYGSLAQATGTALDTGGGTAQVRATLQRSDGYYWNGSSWSSTAFELTSATQDNWAFTMPALPLGTYTFVVNAQDFIGNKSVSSPVVFTIASVKPSITINLPVGGYSYKSLAQVSGAANGTSLASVRVLLQRNSDRLYWTGTAWGASTELAATGTGNWTYKLPALTDDKYLVTAIVRDSAGNSATSATVPFFIDNLGPVIKIAAPVSTVYGSLSQATGTARDAGGGTAQVHATLQRSDGYYWNGSTWVATASEMNSSTLDEWVFNLPALPLGTYTFIVNAQDYVGNKTVSAPVSFSISSVKPSIAINVPGAGYSYKSLAQFSGTASGTSLASVSILLQRNSDKLYWTGSAWGTSTQLAATDTTNWKYTLPSLADNKYFVSATVRDSAGNTATSSIVSFFIDNAGPVIKITTPANTSYGTLPQAIGTALDAGGGTAQVHSTLQRSDGYYWNGTTWTAAVAEMSSATFDNWAFNLPVLPLGTYTFIVNALDYVGNRSTSAPVIFTIASVKPSVFINVPGFDYSYKSLTQISGTADGTNLASIRILLQRNSDKLFWTGSAWGASTELAAAGTSNWTYRLPSLSDNKYFVTAIARDSAGSVATSSTVGFYIDNVGPVLNVASPTNNKYVTTPQAYGTARDAGGGTALVRATLQRGDGLFWNESNWVAAVYEMSSATRDDWAFSFPSLPADTYTFTVSAQDYIGNKTISSPVVFNIVGFGLVTGTNSPEKSPVVLSTASAHSGEATLQLVFSGPLSTNAALDVTRYSVTINGEKEVISGVKVFGGATIVDLQMPALFIAGDSIALHYEVLDNMGRTVKGDRSLRLK